VDDCSRPTTTGATTSSSRRVRVWEPGARLVFAFRAHNFVPGQVTEVEIRFEPELDGTRVTLEHRGWSQIAPEHPARHGLQGRRSRR